MTKYLKKYFEIIFFVHILEIYYLDVLTANTLDTV